jgi:hypothetical protein
MFMAVVAYSKEVALMKTKIRAGLIGIWRLPTEHVGNEEYEYPGAEPRLHRVRYAVLC